MKDLDNSKAEMNESPAPSNEPSISLPSLPNVPLEVVRQSHTMLTSFREGVREGTYQGKHLMSIAQGLMFLDTLIGQSQGQLERARNEQKEALKAAKEKIGSMGGQVNGGAPDGH